MLNGGMSARRHSSPCFHIHVLSTHLVLVNVAKKHAAGWLCQLCIDIFSVWGFSGGTVAFYNWKAVFCN